MNSPENHVDSIPEISAEAKLLAVAFSKMLVGEIITYETMMEITGRSREKIRTAIQTARRVVLRENQIVLLTVLSVGLKRASDAEVVRASESFTPAVVRRANREAKKLSTVIINNLDEHSVSSLRKGMMTVEMFRLFGGSKAQSKLDAAAKAANSVLPNKNILKLFIEE
jgi:hypothetical protein